MSEKQRIWLSPPHMCGEEQKFVDQAFKSNWIAPLGPNVNGFEEDLCKYNGISGAAALSSGTAAIHLALILLGVESGDEVIAPSFTFSATINPILYQKATPVLVDSETETWNISPQFLEKAIKDGISRNKKPKAIILVHLYGMPAKVDEIVSLANQYEIPIIEDAAEALGSTYQEQHLGTFGDVGVYSFNGNKIITTSGGGALVSDNLKLVEKARYLATQARDPAPHYQHSEIGYNYRLSNICAGIGRGQMQVIDDRVRQRRAIFENYRKGLDAHDGITFLMEPEKGYFSNRWLTTILIDSKKCKGVTCDDIMTNLEEQNIESRPLWKPMHLQPVFKQAPYFGEDLCESLFVKGLCLPSGSNLTNVQLDNIINIIARTII